MKSKEKEKNFIYIKLIKTIIFLSKTLVFFPLLKVYSKITEHGHSDVYCIS